MLLYVFVRNEFIECICVGILLKLISVESLVKLIVGQMANAVAN